MSTAGNAWQTLESRTVYQGRWLTVYEDKVITPSGIIGTYEYIKNPPFVLVVALDGPDFVMVRQHRYRASELVTEFPGGSIDIGESPLDAAKREFEEETGLVAKVWKELGVISNPNQATVFLAQDLIKTDRHKMQDDGIEGITRLTKYEVNKLIIENKLTDSKTLAAILLFERCRS